MTDESRALLNQISQRRQAERAFLIAQGMDEAEAAKLVRTTIRDYLRQAILDNKAYIALASPTTTERNNQITKLTRQMIRVERLLLNDLTSAE